LYIEQIIVNNIGKDIKIKMNVLFVIMK